MLTRSRARGAQAREAATEREGSIRRTPFESIVRSVGKFVGRSRSTPVPSANEGTRDECHVSLRDSTESIVEFSRPSAQQTRIVTSSSNTTRGFHAPPIYTYQPEALYVRRERETRRNTKRVHQLIYYERKFYFSNF